MALHTPAFRDETRTRALTGGPRRRAATRYEKVEHPVLGTGHASHMPLDTDIHWDWTNPLNIIPALMLLLLVVALVGIVLGI